MILTVTVNPCLDKTVFLPEFRLGETNIASAVREDVAGKGINAAVAAKALGESVFCIAPQFAQGGEKLKAFLDAQEISNRLIHAEGQLRTNIKIFSENDGGYTELNEKGAPLSEAVWNNLTDALLCEAEKCEVVALCGSLPPAAPKDYYQKIILALCEKHIPVVLDTSGEPLALGVSAKPTCIKPNLAELETLCGQKFHSTAEIIEAAQMLCSEGIRYVCVSMGERGAILVTDAGAYFAPPLALNIRGVQGAGDSMVAGLCHAIAQKYSPEEMLKTAVAAASASLEREGSLLCTAQGFAEKLAKVRIKRLDKSA